MTTLPRALMALLLLFTPALARADDPPAAELAASEETLTARWAAMREAVEKELGASFDPPPRFRPTTRQELLDVLVAELSPLVAGMENVPQGEALEPALRQQLEGVSFAMCGKAVAGKGEVLIVGETFRRLADIAPEWAAMGERAFLDVILIHEAVHVWQDRRFGLNEFRSGLRTDEQLRVRGCVIEGHAQVITRRVAAALGLTEAYELFVASNAKVPSTVKDPMMRQLMQTHAAVMGMQYVEGERFAAAVLKALGDEAGTRRLFEAPPASLGLISRPADYLDPPAAAAVDVRGVMEKVKGILPEGWQKQVIAIPAGMLRGGLAQGGPEAEKWLEEGFLEAVVAAAGDPGAPGRQVTVSLLRCSSPAAATQLMAIEEKISRLKDEELGKPGGMAQITRADYTDAEYEGHEGKFIDKTLTTFQGDIVVRTMIVVRAEYVVEVLSVHAPGFDKPQLRDLVKGVLEHLPAAQ